MRDYLEELKRRKVGRVVIAYVIVGWVLIQIAETTFAPMGLPDWSLTLVIVLTILGLPLATVKEFNLKAAADKLQVAHILEGSVRKSGN